MSIFVGADQIKSLYVGAEKIVKAYVGETLVFSAENAAPSRLPAGYTEVEYIQNNNTNSYIKTERSIYASDFELIVSLPYGAPTSTQFIFESTGSRMIISRNKISFWGDTIASGKFYNIYTAVGTDKINISIKGNILTVNDISTTTDQKSYATNIIIPATSSIYNQIIRFYYAKGEISENTDKANNFELIPCINQSGIAGLYDLLNSEFIVPTGTFTAGPAV